MSYCSHSLLDYDPTIGLYRCRDCPVHFEARAVHTRFKEEKKVPNRTLSMMGIGAGLVFALAVLFMFFKLQNNPNTAVLGSNQCPDIGKWEKMAENANMELRECLKKPPKIKIVEIPTSVTQECPACPQIPDIVVPQCPEMPKIPECPKYEPKECPQSYKDQFSQCMEQRGDALYKLGQCERGKSDCSEKVQIALKGANRKIEELRAVISKMTLQQGGKCPDVAVSVPESGCSKEIEAACGNLRDALEFYFSKSEQQPGKEDAEGYTVENTLTWQEWLKPKALIQDDDDDDFEELDLEEE